jgi:hypothetical protein
MSLSRTRKDKNCHLSFQPIDNRGSRALQIEKRYLKGFENPDLAPLIKFSITL